MLDGILYQWDTGRKIVINNGGDGITEAYSAHDEDDNKERVQHCRITNTSQFMRSYDGQGDAVMMFMPDPESYVWIYFLCNFRYGGISSNASALTGLIITINKPIGNGGYDG